jgi:hypothetical protein
MKKQSKKRSVTPLNGVRSSVLINSKIESKKVEVVSD